MLSTGFVDNRDNWAAFLSATGNQTLQHMPANARHPIVLINPIGNDTTPAAWAALDSGIILAFY
jgi:hypothetical protein